MNFTLNFLKVIGQIALVATATFIMPAILHTIVTGSIANYTNDLASVDYQLGMGFGSAFVTILYIVAYGMEAEERAERKRLGLNQSNKF
jgi:hypothetical protein